MMERGGGIHHDRQTLRQYRDRGRGEGGAGSVAS